MVDEGSLESSKSSEASWVASLSNIGQLFGSLMTGYMSGSCGRKRTIIFLCLPLIGGWTTIGLSGGDFKWLCVGRILQGLGIMSSVSQVYLVEIADSKRRGWIGGSGALSVSAGITMVYILGSCMNWRWVCLVCGLHVASIMVAMMFMPETPNWLIAKDRKDEAVKVLLWLRGPQHNIEEEVKDLSSKMIRSNPGTDPGSSPGTDHGSPDETGIFRQLMKPSNCKPFLLLITLFVLMQSTGTFAVIFYAVNVFQDAGVTSNSYIAAIFVGFLRLIGSLGGTLLLQKVPRRKLLIISGICMGISMTGLSASLYIYDNDHGSSLGTNRTLLEVSEGDSEEADQLSQGITIFCLVFYMLSYGLGVGTVPWLLLGELTPSGIKGITSGVVTCSAFLTIFIVVKLFPISLQIVGGFVTYLGFAGICFLTSTFSYLCIPETRGKTLAEIMTIFEPKQRSKADEEK